MKLLNDTTERNEVLIYDRDEQHLIATVIGMPAYRVAPTGDTSFTFYETSADQPVGLRTWFYPGENFGLEFSDTSSHDVAHR